MYKGLQKRIDKIKDRLKNDFTQDFIDYEIYFRNDFVSISFNINNRDYYIFEKGIIVYRENRDGILNNFNICRYGYGMWVVSNRDYIKEIIIKDYFNE